jgi:hypothetical protein
MSGKLGDPVTDTFLSCADGSTGPFRSPGCVSRGSSLAVITRCDHYIGPPLELGIDLLDLCHLDGVSRCWRAAYLDQTPQRPIWTGATTIANFADQPRKGTKSRSLQIRSVLSSQSRCAAPRSCARVLGGGGSTVGEVRATDAGDLRRDCQMRWCDGGLLGLSWNGRMILRKTANAPCASRPRAVRTNPGRQHWL